MATFQTAFEVELGTDELYEIVEIDFEIEYSGYSEKGCRRGTPDNWTPDESEMEVTRVTPLTAVIGFTSEAIECACRAQYEDKITEECWDDLNTPEEY